MRYIVVISEEYIRVVVHSLKEVRMSELFDDDDKIVIADDDLVEAEEIIDTHRVKPLASDARRRLEALMEEKRLQSELEDEWD